MENSSSAVVQATTLTTTGISETSEVEVGKITITDTEISTSDTTKTIKFYQIILLHNGDITAKDVNVTGAINLSGRIAAAGSRTEI